MLMSDLYDPDLYDSVSDAASVSRRAFLGRVAALGFGASAFLTACGGGEEAAPASGAAPGGSVIAAECEGYDALTPEELQPRQALGYVDNTPDPAQHCSNCRFYNAPAGGAACGGCQLFKGPVAPGGYCNSWAALAA